MHGAFCDQIWRGNDAGDDPVYPVQRGVAIRRTRLTSHACPMFCFVGLLSAFREFNFSVFSPGEEKIQQNST